jgi:hypothetical protein
LSTFVFPISQPGNSAGTGATATATTSVSGAIATMTLSTGGSGYTGSSFVFNLPQPPAYVALT